MKDVGLAISFVNFVFFVDRFLLSVFFAFFCGKLSPSCVYEIYL